MALEQKKRPLNDRDQAAWDAVKKTIRPLDERPTTPPPPKAPRNVDIRETAIPSEWFATEAVTPNQSVDRKTRRKIVTGRQDFDRSVDLHGMTQDAAFSMLKRVIEGCVLRGDKTLLVVTGKGGKRFSQTAPETPVAYRTRDAFEGNKGVLRRMVPMWLSGAELKPFVHSFGEAAKEHGGEGALYVLLRRRAPGTRAK